VAEIDSQTCIVQFVAHVVVLVVAVFPELRIELAYCCIMATSETVGI